MSEWFMAIKEKINRHTIFIIILLKYDSINILNTVKNTYLYLINNHCMYNDKFVEKLKKKIK
jgi:hypothetical protein